MADDQTDPTASADANPPDPAGPVAPLEGEVVAHDAAGTVVRRACFRAGALHGPFRLYGPSGGLVREAFYEDGLAHGPATDYDAQGRLLAETTWRAGRRDGPARVYRNGRLSIEMVWKGDLLERFPLPIEDAHAQGLIEQLVRDVASVRIERHVLCLPVERHLVPYEDGSWSLQSTVALPNSIQAGQLATLFGLTPGELPRAGELALCVGSERLITTVRRMAGSDGYRVERRPWSYSGEISAHEHVLHFSVPDGRVWSGIAPRGEALDDDLPWAFSVGEPAHRFLRQGGGSVAAPEALVALPAGWHIRCGEGAEALGQR